MKQQIDLRNPQKGAKLVVGSAKLGGKERSGYRVSTRGRLEL